MTKRTSETRQDIQELREQVARLALVIQQHQHQMKHLIEQQVANQQRQFVAQDAQVTALRAQESVAQQIATTVAPSHRAEPARTAAQLRRERRGAPTGRSSSSQAASRGSSRRALLKWGGATAAAAAVTLVASERGGQATHAAEMANGSSVTAGNTTTAEAPTVVSYDGTSGNAKVILLANDSSLTASQASYPAALGGWIGSSPASGNTTGVYGYSAANNGYGVVGSATSGVGMYAVTTDTTNSSPALRATNTGSADGADITGASNANGVLAVANGAAGVGLYGQTDSGYGVVGHSSTGIDLYAYGTGRILQVLQTAAGAPTTGTHTKGEQIRDANGELWLCTASGTPGTWVQVYHLASGATAGGLTSYLSKSIRLLDTRGGDSLALNNGGGPYTGGPYPLQIAGVNWQGVTVPSNCGGAIGNVTAVAGSAGGGYLALVPHGAGFSGTANLDFSANQIVCNWFNVALSSGGAIDIIIGGYPTDVIIDLFATVS